MIYIMFIIVQYYTVVSYNLCTLYTSRHTFDIRFICYIIIYRSGNSVTALDLRLETNRIFYLTSFVAIGIRYYIVIKT